MHSESYSQRTASQQKQGFQIVLVLFVCLSVFMILPVDLLPKKQFHYHCQCNKKCTLPTLTSLFFFCFCLLLPRTSRIFISLWMIFTSLDNNIVIVVGNIVIVGLLTSLAVALPICISAVSVATVARNGCCHMLKKTLTFLDGLIVFSGVQRASFATC